LRTEASANVFDSYDSFLVHVWALQGPPPRFRRLHVPVGSSGETRPRRGALLVYITYIIGQFYTSSHMCAGASRRTAPSTEAWFE
jgi:hypothetical protein